ncbi:cytochrome c biogenesis CcdA family protein [Streptomonospora wellingtoniae]|uniref:Cytochrome c biogenesis protein CcdA n=1 Tax=Streptomonospora wellingtoniae TaxID=3075544 RepID=A0ABU2KN76_9ACTN|nr:cytochrome c biogenesis protein CcdA [Streptomonospora sp. DSM 45055]MDT0300652.1 cytochrome c biogenesis protein CcdA [Streptomonospora sp. DSM 45055]
MEQVPFAIALAAGMLAVLNPCGFALLPGYVALLVAESPDARTGRLPALGRALATTTAMTGGFVAVFGLFALVATPLALSLERYLPWATVVIGAVLVALGVWLLSGGRFAVPGLRTPSPGRATRSLRWAAAYGTAYATASLSCTVAPFLAVTTTAATAGGATGAVGVFLAYTAGMALVVAVLTVAAALARDGIAARLRRVLPYVSRAGGALLVPAGAYVSYYGWFELRVLSGQAASDPVVSAATGVQSALVRALEQAGPVALLAVLAGLAAAAVAAAGLRRRSRADAGRG